VVLPKPVALGPQVQEGVDAFGGGKDSVGQERLARRGLVLGDEAKSLLNCRLGPGWFSYMGKERAVEDEVVERLERGQRIVPLAAAAGVLVALVQNAPLNKL
jgi:hypothetical protein